MKYLQTFLCLTFLSLGAWEPPLPTTQTTITRWFENGIDLNATHLVVVCDLFDYEDFPVYIYEDESPEERVIYWNSQDFCKVMEVYDIQLDMNAQLNESRAWHY